MPLYCQNCPFVPPEKGESPNVKEFAFRTGFTLLLLSLYFCGRYLNPIFKAHLFLGLTILLLFPFTRLVHMLSAPVRYIWRPGYQIVRSKKALS